MVMVFGFKYFMSQVLVPKLASGCTAQQGQKTLLKSESDVEDGMCLRLCGICFESGQSIFWFQTWCLPAKTRVDQSIILTMSYIT